MYRIFIYKKKIKIDYQNHVIHTCIILLQDDMDMTYYFW